MRTEAIVPRCAWCGRFRNSTQWFRERRSRVGMTYTDGICPTCKQVFFPELLKSEPLHL